jgi:hypothetical protein
MKKIVLLALIPMASVVFAGSVKNTFENSLPDWTPVKAHPTPLVQADFNGDGLIDTALLVKHKTKDLWQIVLFWQQADQQWIAEPIPQHSPDTDIADVRIVNQPGGSYQTLCFHPQISCKKDQLAEVCLKSEGIRLTVLEASESILYWDGDQKKILRAWLSD